MLLIFVAADLLESPVGGIVLLEVAYVRINFSKELERDSFT